MHVLITFLFFCSVALCMFLLHFFSLFSRLMYVLTTFLSCVAFMNVLITYVIVKRGLCECQKRLMRVSKEAYVSVKRGLCDFHNFNSFPLLPLFLTFPLLPLFRTYNTEPVKAQSTAPPAHNKITQGHTYESRHTPGQTHI